MLEQLSEVQRLDLELDALDSERADVPSALVEIRLARKALEERIAGLVSERDALRLRVRQADTELQGLRDRVKEASESALRADTAKEAAQYQNQEMQFSTRAQELEEDTLPAMEELEALETLVDELQGQHAELVPKHEGLEAKEKERLDEIDTREQSIRENRDSLAQSVDAALLKQYDQVRRARRGIGMAELVGGRRCGGCNMQLPLHVVQKAAKPSAIVRCPSCGRILWNRSASA